MWEFAEKSLKTIGESVNWVMGFCWILVPMGRHGVKDWRAEVSGYSKWKNKCDSKRVSNPKIQFATATPKKLRYGNPKHT